MATLKRIVCLANSRKLNGRCVAGIELSPVDGAMGWIRPVSARENEEVSAHERQYQDGKEPQLLDLIDLPLLELAPNGCQTENWLLDHSTKWQRAGRADVGQLVGYCDRQKTIWVNGYSTKRGENDEIPLDEADALHNSLMLIQVPWIKLVVYENDKSKKLCARGWFPYGGEMYGLRITDPTIEDECFHGEVRLHSLGEAFLTISLTEPLRKEMGSGRLYRYKVIAAIIRGNLGST